MSHQDQLSFVSIIRDGMPEYFHGTRVLEVGSLDINGSIRPLFVGCSYIGLDVAEGRGVDIAVPGEQYDAPDASFDVVISCECMEHNPAWQATLANMARMLRPGGLFVLSCAGPGRQEHGTSSWEPLSSPLTLSLGQEYYRNLSARELGRVEALTSAMQASADWINWASRDLYFLGVKGGAPLHDGWHGMTERMREWVERRNAGESGVAFREAVLRVGGTRAVDMWDQMLRPSQAKRRLRRRAWAVKQRLSRNA